MVRCSCILSVFSHSTQHRWATDKHGLCSTTAARGECVRVIGCGRRVHECCCRAIITRGECTGETHCSTVCNHVSQLLYIRYTVDSSNMLISRVPPSDNRQLQRRITTALHCRGTETVSDIRRLSMHLYLIQHHLLLDRLFIHIYRCRQLEWD